jgi:hypothetical protein
MADDPMTVDSSEKKPMRDGMVKWRLVVSGPADYNATVGAAFDLSSYVSKIWQCSFGGCTALADNGIIPRYINDDFDDADGGTVAFHWSADGTDGEVFVEVTDATNLSGYQWQVMVEGEPA